MATAIIATALALQIKYAWKTVDFDQLQAILIIDFGFVSTLFGINAYQGVVANKKTTATTTVQSNETETLAQTTTVKETKPPTE